MRFLLFLFIAFQASAATYYIDKVDGQDVNAGTSPGSPWKNCPGMAGQSTYTGSGTLAAGDTVYLDSRDTWIVANLVQAGAGWLLTNGVHYIGNEWPFVSNRWGARIQASTNCDASMVRFISDHATIPTWLDGFEIFGDGHFANGVGINHPYWVPGMIKATKRIEDCWVHDFDGRGDLGLFYYGIIISDDSTDGTGRVANVEVLNCVVENPARDGISLYPTSGSISNILVRGCTVFGASHDVSYTEGHGIVVKGLVKDSIIEYCVVTNVESAAVFINGPEAGPGPGPTNLIVRHNILGLTVADEGVVRVYGTGTKKFWMYGNIILENEITGGLSFSANSGSIEAYIYNNTFFDSFVDIGNPTSTGIIEFKGNIIYEPDDIPLTDAGPDITSHSHNHFYRVTGTTFVSSGGTTYNAGQVTTYEATGLSSDPLFSNTSLYPNSFAGAYPNFEPDRSGLSLQSGSAARDTSIDLGGSFNTSINSVPRSAPWDRGAYETLRVDLVGPRLKGIRLSR